MNLKQFFQILAVVVLSSLLYEFLFQALRNYLINDNMGTYLFSLFFALACVLIFVYFKKDFTLNEILKYFFLSSILRVIFGPYFMFLMMKLNLAFIFEKPVVRNEEFVFSELIIDLLKFILIILIVQFKLKDILYCVVIAFLIFVRGMFIPHHIIKFN